MEKERDPTRHQRFGHEPSDSPVSPQAGSGSEHAIRFLLDSINATIYSSGDDYLAALDEFFPQVQALGHLVGAVDLDEVSAFLRDRRHW